MQVQAVAKGISISPRKAGLVASLVRGRSVSDAEAILDHTPKKAAPLIKKVILSAKANAVNNHKLKEDSLEIAQLVIGQGTAIKRYRPAAMGRALPYKRYTSHIKVVLSGDEAKPTAKKPKTANKPATKGKKG